jgi:transcriptional regulator with XRE-family HTH domain
LKNHRRAGRESRGVPRESSLARGLHISTIGRIEEGVTEVYPQTIRRIAEVLSVDPKSLTPQE